MGELEERVTVMGELEERVGDRVERNTVRLVDLVLGNVESQEVYRTIIARRIRMQIDPEFSERSSRDVAMERATSYVVFTERFIRFSANLIERTALSADVEYEDNSKVPFMDSTNPVVFRDLIFRLWEPLPDADISDFSWLETTCAAVVSNHLVRLIENSYRNALGQRFLSSDPSELTATLRASIEPLLGGAWVRQLEALFTDTFVTPLFSTMIDLVGARLALRRIMDEGFDWLDLKFEASPLSQHTEPLFDLTFDHDPVIVAREEWAAAKIASLSQIGRSLEGGEGARVSAFQDATQDRPHDPQAQREGLLRQDKRRDKRRDRQCIVWFATNRTDMDPAHPGARFGSRPDPHDHMHFGRSTVVYTPARRASTVIKTQELRIASQNAFMNEKAFCEAIRDELGRLRAADRRMLVFLHGFNTSFDDAVVAAAQLAIALKYRGIVTCFSWPSVNRLSPLIFRSYTADGNKNQKSAKALAIFLTSLAHEVEAESIDVIAHSMGNRFLLQSMGLKAFLPDPRGMEPTGKSGAYRPFGRLILAAPDVDKDDFLSSDCVSLARSVTVYVSEKDLPLAFSGWLNDVPRAGFVPPRMIVSGIDTIDVSAVSPDWLGHNYFANSLPVLWDMTAVIQKGKKPPRADFFGARTTEGQTYWRLVPRRRLVPR